MYVEAYWNLHKGVFSYRPPGGKVEHSPTLVLSEAKFAVQPAGRDKVRATGRKNVHAFVRGNLRSPIIPTQKILDNLTRVYYDPYKQDFWQTADGRRVEKARFAYLYDKKVWVVL
jgi:hypothetical protein